MYTKYEFYDNGDVMSVVYLNGQIHDYYCAGVHSVDIFDDYSSKRVKTDQFNNPFIEFHESENPPFEATVVS